MQTHVEMLRAYAHAMLWPRFVNFLQGAGFFFYHCSESGTGEGGRKIPFFFSCLFLERKGKERKSFCLYIVENIGCSYQNYIHT